MPIATMPKKNDPPTLSERMNLHAQHVKEIPPDGQHLAILQAVLAVAFEDLAKWIAVEEYKQR